MYFSDSGPVKPTSLSNVLDDMSDSSLDDVSEEEGPTTPIRRNRASAVTSGDMEHSLIKQPLYAVCYSCRKDLLYSYK